MKYNDIISYEDYVVKQRKQAYDLMYPEGLPNWAKDTIFDINEYMNACELSSKGMAFGCTNLKSKLQEIGSYFNEIVPINFYKGIIADELDLPGIIITTSFTNIVFALIKQDEITFKLFTNKLTKSKKHGKELVDRWLNLEGDTCSDKYVKEMRFLKDINNDVCSVLSSILDTGADIYKMVEILSTASLLDIEETIVSIILNNSGWK